MDPAKPADVRPFHPYTELRNRLSELFLEALANPERGVYVLWLRTYCRLARAERLPIPLRSLVEAVSREAATSPRGDRRGPLEALLADGDLLQLRHLESGDVYRGSAILEALRWSTAEAVELYPEFRDHAGYAARRAEKYWAVVGHLIQQERMPEGVEGAVAQGVLVFNAGLFFEYHELLEDPWRAEVGDRKRFLQGLIQVAVGLHHWENGNYTGAVLLLREGAERLRVGMPHMLGLDVTPFYHQVHAARSALEGLGREHARELDASLIPKQRPALVPSPSGRGPG